ncbi:MAG: cache domain-containing protein [Candidatus Tyrphobacter sp.]
MKFSLRTRLLGAIVGAVVLIFVSSLIAARSVLAHDLFSLGRTEVTSEASAFGGYVASRKKQIQLLVAQEAASDAVRIAVQGHNGAQLAGDLSNTVENSGLSFLTAVDLQGRVLARVHVPSGGSLANDPLVQRALNGETFSTLARLSPGFLQSEGLALQAGVQHDGLAIVSATPISDAQERTIGVLYGGLLLNHSYDLVDEATRAIGGAIALIDDGTIVSSSIVTPDGTRYLDAQVPATAAVIRTGRPYVGSDTEGGVTYLARIDPLMTDQNQIVGASWYGIPMVRITNIIGHTTWTLVLWGLLAVILVLALAVPIVQALSKTLVQNSRRVRETAKELGVTVVGSEVSGDHVTATRRAVERSGELIAELAKGDEAPANVAELQKLNAELHGDVIVIETLAQEMSNRMHDAVERVAELNEVASTLNELVTGESSP